MIVDEASMLATTDLDAFTHGDLGRPERNCCWSVTPRRSVPSTPPAGCSPPSPDRLGRADPGHGAPVHRSLGTRRHHCGCGPGTRPSIDDYIAAGRVHDCPDDTAAYQAVLARYLDATDSGASGVDARPDPPRRRHPQHPRPHPRHQHRAASTDRSCIDGPIAVAGRGPAPRHPQQPQRSTVGERLPAQRRPVHRPRRRPRRPCTSRPSTAAGPRRSRRLRGRAHHATGGPPPSTPRKAPPSTTRSCSPDPASTANTSTSGSPAAGMPTMSSSPNPSATSITTAYRKPGCPGRPEQCLPTRSMPAASSKPPTPGYPSTSKSSRPRKPVPARPMVRRPTTGPVTAPTDRTTPAQHGTRPPLPRTHTRPRARPRPRPRPRTITTNYSTVRDQHESRRAGDMWVIFVK